MSRAGRADPAGVARERDLYLRILRLARVDSIEPLLQETLALVVEITGALQAYLEINDPRSQDEPPRWWLAHDCTRVEVNDIQSRLSRGVIAAALASGRTVETPSAMLDERFRERESVRIGHIEAVLCVPIGEDPPLGVVYLQGRRSGGQFSPEAREQLEILASHLAPVADRIVERIREERDRDPTRAVRSGLRAEALVGRSEAAAALLRQISLFAPLDVPVLLCGAAGTGKRLAARVLHESSPRAGQPLVELRCRDHPAEELERVLFGDGTGVPARIDEAAGGSLLLSDVERLPSGAQKRLAERIVARRSEGPRLLAASEADLEAAVADGRFREDLFRQLQTLWLRVPTLAERAGDVSELARAFCAQSCEQRRGPILHFSRRALRALEASEWPGNVRQLASAVDAAVERALREGVRRIESRHLFPHAAGLEGEDPHATFQEATREFQKALLGRVLEECHWNVTAAARRLDLTRSHVYNLINAFALTRKPH